MKYYKTESGVRAIGEAGDIDGDQSSLVQPSWVLMTAEEVETHNNPPKTQDQIDAEAKQAKELALSLITVTTSTGKEFDGRPIDIPLMTGAIDAAGILGLNEHKWKLHDNTVVLVTLTELKEALALSMQAIGAIKVS